MSALTEDMIPKKGFDIDFSKWYDYLMDRAVNFAVNNKNLQMAESEYRWKMEDEHWENVVFRYNETMKKK